MEADFKGDRADYLVSRILDNGLNHWDSVKGGDNRQSGLFWKMRLAMEAEFKGAGADYIVSINLDDELDHGDSVEAAGLTVN